MGNTNSGDRHQHENGEPESMLSSDSVDVESSLQDHGVATEKAQLQQGEQLEREMHATAENNMAHLSNLRTFGILLESLKVIQANRATLWRTVWFVGLPETIVQTALFAATNLSIVLLVTHVRHLFRYMQHVKNDPWAATSIGVVYVLFLLMLGRITIFVGESIVERSSIYIRKVAILLRNFYSPRSSTCNTLCEHTALAPLRSSMEDQNASKKFFRDIYRKGAFFFLVVINCTQTASLSRPTQAAVYLYIYFSLLFIVTGMSLLSNFALPVSGFIASVERWENGCIWKAKVLTKGGKFWAATTLRTLLYALCIPQIFVIIKFSIWTISYSGLDSASDSGLWQSAVVPLALLAFHVFWGTVNTMVSTIAGGVLYFSCKAYLRENATDFSKVRRKDMAERKTP